MLGCLADAAVDLRVLSDPQQHLTGWAALLGADNGVFGYPVLWFHVPGPLLEGRGGTRSLEEVR